MCFSFEPRVELLYRAYIWPAAGAGNVHGQICLTLGFNLKKNEFKRKLKKENLKIEVFLGFSKKIRVPYLPGWGFLCNAMGALVWVK